MGRCVIKEAELGGHGMQPTRLLHPWDFPGKSMDSAKWRVNDLKNNFNGIIWYKDIILYAVSVAQWPSLCNPHGL